MEPFAVFFKALKSKEIFLFQKLLESEYWGKCSNEHKLFEYCIYYLHPKLPFKLNYLQKENLPNKIAEKALQKTVIIETIFQNWQSRNPSYSILTKRFWEIIEDFELFLYLGKSDTFSQIERAIFLCHNILKEKELKEVYKHNILKRKFENLAELIAQQPESEQQTIWDFELNRMVYFYYLNFERENDNNRSYYQRFFQALEKMIYVLSSKHIVSQIHQEKAFSDKLKAFAEYIYLRVENNITYTNSNIVYIYDYLLSYYLKKQDFDFTYLSKKIAADVANLAKEEQSNIIRISHNIGFNEYKKGKATINDLFVITEKMILEEHIFTNNMITDVQFFPLIDMMEDFLLYLPNLPFFKDNILIIKKLIKKIKSKIVGTNKEFLDLYLDAHLAIWENINPFYAIWQRVYALETVKLEEEKLNLRCKLLMLKTSYKRNYRLTYTYIQKLEEKNNSNLSFFLGYMKKMLNLLEEADNKRKLLVLKAEIQERNYFLYKHYLLFEIEKLV